MVMQRTQPQRPGYGNTMLIWLGLAILIIGGGFIYVYGVLRQPTLTVGASAPATTTQAGEASVPASAKNSLRDLGIDPERSGLSPEAQSAIAKAHQAALAESRKQAAEEAAPAGSPAAPNPEPTEDGSEF